MSLPRMHTPSSEFSIITRKRSSLSFSPGSADPDGTAPWSTPGGIPSSAAVSSFTSSPARPRPFAEMIGVTTWLGRQFGCARWKSSSLLMAVAAPLMERNRGRPRSTHSARSSAEICHVLSLATEWSTMAFGKSNCLEASTIRPAAPTTAYSSTGTGAMSKPWWNTNRSRSRQSRSTS